MREESAFDPNAVSPADAFGLMQLIVPTARELGRRAGLPWSPSALKRPSVNVALGCRALASFASRFEANPLLTIPAYNAGPSRAKRWLEERPLEDFDVWIELIPFQETRRYTKRVLSSRAAYGFLYEEGDAASRALLPLKVDTRHTAGLR
jgi:soluble lytic murein transglycosylase